MIGRDFINAAIKHEDTPEITTSVSRICSHVPPSVQHLRREITPEITKHYPCRCLPKWKRVLLVFENIGHLLRK
jgi:hypothetical protein